MVAFAGEHCHPSFYSTGHGAYLTGRTAAQFFLSAAARAAAAAAAAGEEEVYNLGAASVADLTTWLQDIQMGEKDPEDFKSRKAKERAKRDNNKFVTPR